MKPRTTPGWPAEKRRRLFLMFIEGQPAAAVGGAFGVSADRARQICHEVERSIKIRGYKVGPDVPAHLLGYPPNFKADGAIWRQHLDLVYPPAPEA